MTLSNLMIITIILFILSVIKVIQNTAEKLQFVHIRILKIERDASIKCLILRWN